MKERNYKYFMFINKKTGNKCVAAVTRSCGQTIRAVAECQPEDLYDEEKGKQIAARKCDIKICSKRIEQLEAQKVWYEKEIEYYTNRLSKVSDQEEYLISDLKAAACELHELSK